MASCIYGIGSTTKLYSKIKPMTSAFKSCGIRTKRLKLRQQAGMVLLNTGTKVKLKTVQVCVCRDSWTVAESFYYYKN